MLIRRKKIGIDRQGYISDIIAFENFLLKEDFSACGKKTIMWWIGDFYMVCDIGEYKMISADKYFEYIKFLNETGKGDRTVSNFISAMKVFRDFLFSKYKYNLGFPLIAVGEWVPTKEEMDNFFDRVVSGEVVKCVDDVLDMLILYFLIYKGYKVCDFEDARWNTFYGNKLNGKAYKLFYGYKDMRIDLDDRVFVRCGACGVDPVNKGYIYRVLDRFNGVYGRWNNGNKLTPGVVYEYFKCFEER